MALFSRKKNTETKEAAVEKKAAAPKGTKAVAPKAPAPSSSRDLSGVLKHARITERATFASAQSVYVFDVDTAATKRDIMQAVQSLYKVSPRKIRVVNSPKKVIRSMRTGRTGVKGGGKKAYVYLKAGETIAIS